jgi:hypothetical protein
MRTDHVKDGILCTCVTDELLSSISHWMDNNYELINQEYTGNDEWELVFINKRRHKDEDQDEAF